MFRLLVYRLSSETFFTTVYHHVSADEIIFFSCDHSIVLAIASFLLRAGMLLFLFLFPSGKDFFYYEETVWLMQRPLMFGCFTHFE